MLSFTVTGMAFFILWWRRKGSLGVIRRVAENKKRSAGRAGGRVVVQLMVAGDVPNQRAAAVMDVLMRAGMDSVVLKTFKDS